jgi:hypothetical protein
MKAIICSLILFLSCQHIHAQEITRYDNLKYKGFSHHGTLNTSFINKRILFVRGNDSVIFNIKIPFNVKTKNSYDPGIFYNCRLAKDSTYSFEIEKTTPKQIPKEYNSYYKINGVFNYSDKSKFTEIRKNTRYRYVGNTGMFIDAGHELYKITKMTPAGDCTMQL